MAPDSSPPPDPSWRFLARLAVVPVLLFLLLYQPERFEGFALKMAALGAAGGLLVLSFWRGRPDFSGLAPGLRQLFARGDRAARTVLLATALYGVVLLAMPFSVSASHVLIDRFLLNGDFLTWALWQPCPAFYSAENRWVSLEGDIAPPPDVVDSALQNDPHFIIHFPARVVYQPRLFDEKSKTKHGFVWDLLESRYRGETLRALYRIEYEPGVRHIQRYRAENVE